MKRLICIILLFVFTVQLTGCVDAMFTTHDYRTYNAFAKRHKPGTEKQDVLASLGEPVSYSNGQESYRKNSFDDRAQFTKNIMDNDATVWVYECYEMPDPANPYRLIIRFDDEGKTTEIKWYLVPGG